MPFQDPAFPVDESDSELKVGKISLETGSTCSGLQSKLLLKMPGKGLLQGRTIRYEERNNLHVSNLLWDNN
jgi:hypothetical protein